MALAGSDENEFELNGRKILRHNGQLTLEDGTLAGADLDMLRAVRTLVTKVDVPLEDALNAATHIPAALIGSDQICPSPKTTRRSDLVRISPDLQTLSWL
jgi:N-acetylglucosamine-6-phosphate deacetylase